MLYLASSLILFLKCLDNEFERQALQGVFCFFWDRTTEGFGTGNSSAEIYPVKSMHRFMLLRFSILVSDDDDDGVGLLEV